MLLNFGQPVNGIVQTAFVVEDVQVAIQRWIAELNVGPWFLLPNFAGDNPLYRGEPSRSVVSIAMAFAGHMQIELLQPLDDAPSVYKETIEARGYGFHHHGLAVADFAGTAERLRAKGYEEAFRAGVPSGGEVIYFDTKGATPGFIEIFEASAGMEDAFTRQYLASVGWHGEDPVRPFG